jgi:hypothetical protein
MRTRKTTTQFAIRANLKIQTLRVQLQTEVADYIRTTASPHQSRNRFRPKNNLTQTELGRRWEDMLAGSLSPSILQEYTLDLFIWWTGLRPSSIIRTNKNLSLLHWKNIKFAMTPVGIAAQVITKTLKRGEKQEHQEQQSSLVFTRLPVQRQEHHHLDYSALLFAMAASRGLFIQSVDHIWSHVPRSIAQAIPVRVKSKYRHSPVFIRGRNKVPSLNSPLTAVSALNNLRSRLMKNDLVGRFSYYSYRGTAVVKVRRRNTQAQCLQTSSCSPSILVP